MIDRDEYAARLIRVDRADRLALAVDLGLGLECRIAVQLSGVQAQDRGTVGGEHAAWWIHAATIEQQLVARVPGPKVGDRWLATVWLGELDGARVEPDLGRILTMLDLASVDVPASVREAQRRLA